MRSIILFFLVLVFTSCVHQMEEESLVKSSELATRGIYDTPMDTLRYPAIQIAIARGTTQDIILFDIPKLSDYMGNGEQHPEYPIECWYLNNYCYIQYREIGSADRNWYYYHPDTIKYSKPYRIIVTGDKHPESYRSALAELRADRLPRNEFIFRGISFSGEPPQIYKGKVIVPETTWLGDNWSYMSYTQNVNGFIYEPTPVTPSTPGENIPSGYIDVYIQFSLTVFIHLDGSIRGGKYVLKHNGQEYTFSVDYGGHQTFTQNIIVQRGYRRVKINSFCQETFSFNGENCIFSYYVSNSDRGGTITANAITEINVTPNAY